MRCPMFESESNRRSSRDVASFGMTEINSADVSQTVILPQSRDAMFLTTTIVEGGERAALDAITGLSGLVNGVGFRWPGANLSAVVGIGAKLWDRLFVVEKPEHLHEFVELQGAKHHAPSTPGDLFFHIRADRFDVALSLIHISEPTRRS